MHLNQGYTYRGRMIIHGPSFAYSKDTVSEALAGQGFQNIKVWKDSEDLPSDWPSDKRSDPSGSGYSTAYVQALWTKATGEYPSKGDKWHAYDVWTYAKPIEDTVPPDQYGNCPDGTKSEEGTCWGTGAWQPGCTSDGYQCWQDGQCCSAHCLPALPFLGASYMVGVCGQQADPDVQEVGVDEDNSGGLTLGKLLIGAAALAGLGYAAHHYLGSRSGKKAKKNPHEGGIPKRFMLYDITDERHSYVGAEASAAAAVSKSKQVIGEESSITTIAIEDGWSDQALVSTVNLGEDGKVYVRKYASAASSRRKNPAQPIEMTIIASPWDGGIFYTKKIFNDAHENFMRNADSGTLGKDGWRRASAAQVENLIALEPEVANLTPGEFVEIK